jgi:hypothetical protein
LPSTSSTSRSKPLRSAALVQHERAERAALGAQRRRRQAPRAARQLLHERPVLVQRCRRQLRERGHVEREMLLGRVDQLAVVTRHEDHPADESSEPTMWLERRAQEAASPRAPVSGRR